MLHASAVLGNENVIPAPAPTERLGPDAHSTGCDRGLPDDTIIYDRDPELEAYLDELETARDLNADAEADYEEWLRQQAEVIEAEFQMYEAGVELDIREIFGRATPSDASDAA